MLLRGDLCELHDLGLDFVAADRTDHARDPGQCSALYLASAYLPPIDILQTLGGDHLSDLLCCTRVCLGHYLSGHSDWIP